MYLSELVLVDYRNYAEQSLRLGPGPTVLVGDNAQGKTNLLEAVSYLGVGHSHRVSADGPLVRAGADAAIVRAFARTDGGHRLSVELELRPGGRNRVRRNGQPQPRIQDALGRVRSVLFAPEDVVLVRGDPADRRRFLDDLLVQRRPAYLAARREYERVLRQRNALLRAARTGGADEASLRTWTDALATAGAPVVAARIAAVHALAGPTASAYRRLVAASPPREAGTSTQLAYELSTGREVVGESGSGVPDLDEITGELRAGFASCAQAERERGVTLAGPHRDDLALGLHELPAKGYASQGEQWSLALALRLASREVLAEVGDEPIVLLDDVFAELDAERRARLAEHCAAFEQVLVTAAVDEDVPIDGPRAHVRAGTIAGPDGGLGEEAG